MGRAGDDDQSRHSVVPASARRSPWAAAAWTGLGAAVVCAVVAIVAVAVCWLPAAKAGHTGSAIKGGLLTFLAALHGGVTVDGVATSWLPLGMLVIVAVTAWRAGSGLGDAAQAMDERDPVRLVLAGLAQAVTFAVGALVTVPFATLGTSRAPFFGVGVAAFVLFALTGGTAFVRASALRELVAEHLPVVVVAAARAAAAAAVVYLGAGAVLAAASLVVHRTAAEQLSGQVGGGIGGLPVALLGVLAAPNAAIAGAAYLSGPGFAVGSGTTFSLFTTAHGVVPAFPLLAALPSGAHPNKAVWALAAITPLLAAAVVVKLCLRPAGWGARLLTGVAAAGGVAVLMAVLAWQGGGAVGDGRLATVGASPWQAGASAGAAILVLAVGGLGLGAVWSLLRDAGDDADEDDDEPLLPVRRTPRMVVVPGSPADATGKDPGRDDPLAG